MSDQPPRPRWFVYLLTIGPLWLIASAGVAVWLSLRDDEQKQREAEQRFSQDMSETRIADDLRKLDEIIGPRHPELPNGLTALRRTASMLSGILGPSNTGYTIVNLPGIDDAPILTATLPGTLTSSPDYWILAHYDSPKLQHSQPSSSAVASLIATAQAMAEDQPTADIHFILSPFGHAQPTDADQALSRLLNKLGRPQTVIVLDSMNGGKSLIVTSSSEATAEQQALSELGTFVVEKTSHSSTIACLQDRNIPCFLLTTPDQTPVPAAVATQHIAIQSGKLVEWLRRINPASPR